MNHAIMNRLLTTQEAEAIRIEHQRIGTSLSSLGYRLKLGRRTLLDIIHRRGAYSPENDGEHSIRMNDGFRFSSKAKARRNEVVPNIKWPDNFNDC